MMEINIKDYLSEDKMREIAEEEFRTLVRSKSEGDYERVVNNGCYRIVAKMVDDALDGNLEKMIIEKTADVIKNLTSYTVFDSDGGIRNQPSTGRKIITQALDESRDLIRERVAKFIEDLSDYDVLEVLKEQYAEKKG